MRTNNQLPTTAPTDDTRRVVTMRSPRAWRKSRHRRSPDSVIDSIKLESTGATESDSGSPFASPLGTRLESTSGSPFLLASPGPTPEPSGSPLSAPPESTSASPLPTPSTGHLHVAATPPRHIRLPKSIVGETNASLRRVRRTLSMPHLKQDDARKWTEAISYDQRSPRSVKLAVGYFEQHQSGARGKSLRGAKLGRPARAEASERATTTTQTARWLLTAGLALLAASALACAAAAVRPEELTPPPTGTGAAASQPTTAPALPTKRVFLPGHLASFAGGAAVASLPWARALAGGATAARSLALALKPAAAAAGAVGAPLLGRSWPVAATLAGHVLRKLLVGLGTPGPPPWPPAAAGNALASAVAAAARGRPPSQLVVGTAALAASGVAGRLVLPNAAAAGSAGAALARLAARGAGVSSVDGRMAAYLRAMRQTSGAGLSLLLRK